METNKTKLTNGEIAMILFIILSIIGIIIFNLKDDKSVPTPIETDNQKSTNSASPSNQIATSNEPFTYSGNAQDEVGNRAHYEIKIKRDFSEASINGPYQRIELLSDGRYQFIGGTIMGLSFKISAGTCILYTFERSYCKLPLSSAIKIRVNDKSVC